MGPQRSQHAAGPLTEAETMPPVTGTASPVVRPAPSPPISTAPGTSASSPARSASEARPLSRQDQALQKALEHPGDPLPLSVRARLAPVMGRELGAVRLLRNAEAAAATAAAAADALALGDRVLLSPGQDLASPRGLGLLAHELTHVLRERDPDFVPLVAREPARTRGASVPAPSLPSVAATSVQPSAAQPIQAVRNGAAPIGRTAASGEEGLAEFVEAQVRQEMQAPSRSTPSDSPWGGLPAPWEPMPFWDAPATPSGAAQAEQPRRSPDGTSTAGSSSGAAAQAPSAPPPPAARAQVAQAASTSRSVDSSPGPTPTSLGAAVGSDHRKSASPPPDLDRLAQQVYGMIKQRLATETRRNR